MTVVIDAARLRQAVPVAAAMSALAAAFADPDWAQAPPRQHLAVPAGDLLVMPCWSAGGGGVKVVTVRSAPGEVALPVTQGVYVLLDPGTLAPLALLDGAELTALRTAACSALATDRLARPDARRLVIFGAGAQAHAHLEAMLAVRPVDEVTVVSRGRRRAEALVHEAHRRGVQAEVGSPAAVAGADLVCACTTSTAPVFAGADLAAGAHVNAVGGHRPDARELDDDAVRGARVVVETRASAFAEAGDVILAREAGALGDVAELGELLRGAPGRSADGEVTVFKSVGLALEDLAVALAAWKVLGP